MIDWADREQCQARLGPEGALLFEKDEHITNYHHGLPASRTMVAVTITRLDGVHTGIHLEGWVRIDVDEEIITGWPAEVDLNVGPLSMHYNVLSDMGRRTADRLLAVLGQPPLTTRPKAPS